MSLDALTSAALLGTARQQPPPAELPGGLAADGADVGLERRLLREAAVLSVHTEAGARPARVAALPAPAPPEARPVCTPEASRHVAAILHGPYRGALEEWLAALARTGRVLPPEHARALVDLGRANDAIALLAEPVLSERARWLARQQDDWRWAHGGDPAERWETGIRAEREHLLRVVRRSDPAAARELLAGTWSQEPARDREAFLAELAANLDPADEPFLEAALDDRAQSVRARAADLLAALPESALARRMAARLEPLIDARRRKLAVALPDGGPTADMRRDGITDTPPRGTGKHAWVLTQIVAAAPLAVWRRVDAEPGKLLARPVADGMEQLLREAWMWAALRQRDADWAKALLDRRVGDAGARHLLVELLPPAEQERHALALLDGDAEYGGGRIASVLRHRWSPAFTATVARWIATAPYPHAWADALARHGDPDLADRLPQPDPSTIAAALLREAAAQLAFRRTMLETLKETPAA